jgi:hypothetical protein
LTSGIVTPGPGDADAAAHQSGQHWERLGGHITQLFETNQLA